MDTGNDTLLLVAGILVAAVALWLMRNFLRVLYVSALLALGLWLTGLFR
jgi:multisubunit Na+/H+ antiporter MnhE subunit